MFNADYDSQQIVTFAGLCHFSFPDEWNPTLTTAANTYSSSSSVPGSYDYTPITGVRDILGYIRVPDPNVPGVGYGSNPFIDIGAYQYVNLNPRSSRRSRPPRTRHDVRHRHFDRPLLHSGR